MKIKLNYLGIENFKRIKNFRLELEGKSAMISGQNATGKTTLADAFFWLLTDSDSEQQSKFNLLELDENGVPINNQSAGVEAEISVDSKIIVLKKEYKQVWSKKRGEAKSEFVRHKTDHFYNGVPVNKTKYNKKLGNIIDSNIIRAISDVHHFCSRLPWEKRREILMDVLGKVSDEEICKKFGADELSDLLKNKSPDDLKKVFSLEMRTVKEQLDGLPGRIDELQKMRPDLTGLTEEQIENKIGEVQKKIEEKKNEILAIKSGLDISEKKNMVADLQFEKSQVARQVATQLDIDVDDMMEKIQELKRQRIKLYDERDTNHNLMSNGWSMIENYRKEKSRLIEDWKKIDARIFESKETCFACGQYLPDELIATQELEFNNKKADDLKPINERGRWLNDEIKRIEEKDPELKNRIDALEKRLEENVKKQDEIKNKIETQNERKAVEIMRATKSIDDRIFEIQEEIKLQMANISPSIEHVEATIGELDKENNALHSKRLDYVQAKKCDDRIEERKGQLKFWGEKHEEIQRKMLMLEQFSKWKSSFIEQNINDKFSITKWKLFENQVNGGVRDICEATLNGVPYSNDLNTGARINVGLDCIQTLQKHYNVMMPVWIDNAESVTDWMIDSKQQTIKLAASPDIDKLEVIQCQTSREKDI